METHQGEVLRLDYSALIQPEKLPELLQRIADFTGLPKRSKPLGVIDKNKRFSILLCKAMTRSLGRFAPRINTGIKLGS